MAGEINLIPDKRGRTIYEITGLQKIMAHVFETKWPQTPVVHVGVQINTSAASRYRKSYGEKYSVRVSLMNVIQKGAAAAAKSYPLIAGLFDGDDTSRDIVPSPDEIAIAGPVMIGDTAIPVVIERASSKSLGEIADEMCWAVDQLQQRQLSENDAVSAFARMFEIPNVGISNIGMMGPVNFFTAMNITPSLSALYVSTAIDTPVADGSGGIAIAPLVNFCMAFDHRVLAAGPVAKYLGRFKELMEQPELLD